MPPRGLAVAALPLALCCLAFFLASLPSSDDGFGSAAHRPVAESAVGLKLRPETPSNASTGRAAPNGSPESLAHRWPPFVLGNVSWDGVGLAPWLTRTGQTLPGTVEAQASIFLHQNPRICNCRRQRFFVFRLLNQGLGAEVHLISWALGMAMQEGLILQLSHSEWRYAEGQTPHTWERYFLPVTNCSCFRFAGTCTTHAHSDPLSRVCCPTTRGHRLCQAHKVRNLPLYLSPIPTRWSAHPLAWWYAQCARYFWRGLQPWFGADIEKYKQEVVLGGHLPAAGVIGMHVRRSDKVACYHREQCRKTEMGFLPFEAYMRSAEELRRANAALHTIFLTTEDDQVVNETRLPAYSAWRFVIPAEERHNWNHHRAMDERGPLPLVRLSVGNLALHLEAAALVCTMQSNWCRIIDELRRTTGHD
eukprot:EG_transcript_14032